MFIQAWIVCLPCVILPLYLPPPAPLSLLHDAASFSANFPSARVICMGDFNLIHDTPLDRFTASSSISQEHTRTHLALFLEEMGWIDLWRFHNPDLLEYTCFPPGCNSMSRIGYVCGNSFMCSSLTSISHRPRVASDHLPVLVEFLMDSATYSRGIRKIHPFWLTVFRSPDRIPDCIQTFVSANAVNRYGASFWDSLGGSTQSAIIYIKNPPLGRKLN